MSIPLMDNHTEKKAKKVREVPLWVIKLVLLLGLLLVVAPIIAMMVSLAVAAWLWVASGLTTSYAVMWMVTTLIVLGLEYVLLGVIFTYHERAKWLRRHRRQTWQPR